MRFWQDLFPRPLLELRYESLDENPERECWSLLSYCGLGWSADCLRFHEATAAVATPSAVQVRQPIYRTLSDSGVRTSVNWHR